MGASVVVVDDADQPVWASLVSEWEDGAVVVSYVITDPRHRGQGLGAAAVAASLDCLAPGRMAFAGATDGNEASQRLLGSLGFNRIGPS